MDDPFLVARNPDPDSRLPYLVRLPVEGGIAFKVGDVWPTTGRLYCHPLEGDWPDGVEVLEEVPVRSCRRRGVAVDLVLARGRHRRSQFVFTRIGKGAKARPAVFWQTAKTARGARPASRTPTRRASGQAELVIARDTRERYGYRFATQQARVEPRALPAGDYATFDGAGRVVGAVERKTVENLVAGLVDGSLSFQLAELAEVPRATIVVEGRYGELLDLEHVQPGWVLDLLARVQVRYPSVPIVFTGSRKLAEEYTYRLLGAARAELG